jgi:hypothetical protein
MNTETLELQFLAAVQANEKAGHWLRLVPESYFQNATARRIRNKILSGETLTIQEAAFLRQQRVDYTPDMYAQSLVTEGYLKETGQYAESLAEQVRSRKVAQVEQLLVTSPVRPSLEPALTAEERFLLEGEKAVEYAYPLPTALAQLQTYWGRLLPGAIHVVAADNGVGKSLLLEQMALGLALNNVPVVDYSVEMPFIPRMLRYHQHVYGPGHSVNEFYEKWANQQLSSEEIKGIVKPFHQKPLYVQTIARTNEMLVHAEQMYHSRGVRVFGVDFLQALQGPSSMTKFEAIAYSITQIFNFTKRNPSTWMVVSTYNREGKSAQRMDKQGRRQMPANQDLMGANEIETYAWTITHLLREEGLGDNRRFYMTKNRFGLLGDFQLRFNGLTLTFEP